MPLQVGEFIGRLELIEPTGERKGNRKVWLCKCECGAELERSASSLYNSQSAGADAACLACLGEKRLHISGLKTLLAADEDEGRKVRELRHAVGTSRLTVVNQVRRATGDLVGI